MQHTNTMEQRITFRFKMAIHTKPGRCSPISNLWFQCVCTVQYMLLSHVPWCWCMRLFYMLKLSRESSLCSVRIRCSILHICSTHYAHWINGNDKMRGTMNIESKEWECEWTNKKIYIYEDEHIIAPLAFNINKTARASKN